MGIYAGTVNADGSIIIDTRIDTKGADKGVTGLKKQFTSLSSAARKLGAVIGLAFSVTAAVQFGKEASQAAREASDALVGLRSILEGQGRSFADAQQFINEYTEDGLIPATNAITAYKNLAMRGYDDSQIRQVMVALKDASAYGRQASYTMGEAVQSATEGLKNENSILVDNAGVTKNVAKMWEEYAASIGTTSNNLTQQQKIQAEVTGILAESKYQTGDAAKVANTLSGQLQQLSFNFNNLKIAVGDIINPFVQSFLPVINSAISAITRFANTIATVVNTLFGTKLGEFSETLQSVSGGYESAAEGADDLAASTDKAGKAAKKSLAGFDEITKISKESASGGGGAPSSGGGAITAGGSYIQISPAADSETTSPLVDAILDSVRNGDWASIGQMISDKINGAVSNINWASAGQSVSNAFVGFLELINGVIMGTDWQQIGVGIATFMGNIDWSGLLAALSRGIGAILSGIGQLIIGFLTPAWESVVNWWQEVAYEDGRFTMLGLLEGIGSIFVNIYTWLRDNIVNPFVDGIKGLFGIHSPSRVMEDVGIALAQGFLNGFSKIGEWIKSVINGVIGFINQMVDAISDGINYVVRSVNKLSFDVPDWVPLIGGETFGFNLNTIKAPQIPYLAKGAIIPPNSPFMAVLGDQRHGTNIEAPLSTIQEAVALVMEDFAAANMAGQEAIIEVLREILEAVLGIEIGDDVIGNAVERYQRKMRNARGEA